MMKFKDANHIIGRGNVVVIENDDRDIQIGDKFVVTSIDILNNLKGVFLKLEKKDEENHNC